MVKPHHQHLADKMAQKGWSPEDVQHAQAVWKANEKNHHFFVNRIEAFLIIIFFIEIILGSFASAALVMPLLVIFPNYGIYGVVITMGACFGFLAEEILRTVEHRIRFHHHVLMVVGIPIVALVSFSMILGYADQLLPNIFNVERNFLAIGVFYSISFLMPYALTRLFSWIFK